MKNNESKDLCAKCGGRCCKFMPCHLSVKDVFGDMAPTIDRLIEFLSKGVYAIDWWEGDVMKKHYNAKGYRDCCYYVRGKSVRTNDLFHASYGNDQCCSLTETGCSFDWEHRPLGGKALVPDPNGYCKGQGYSKEDCVKEWYPYNHLFDKLRNEYSWERKEDGSLTFTKEE